MTASDLNGADLQCFFVNPEVDLAPAAPFGAAVIARVPLAVAVDLDAGAVDQQVQWPLGATILPNPAGRIGRVDPRRVPVFLRRRVLLVRIGLDKAGVDGHALATEQTFRDAARDGRLKQMAQQFAPKQ